MSRIDVTEKIITTKVAKGIKWSDVAAKVGQSKEWTTAACLGQMTLTAEQASIVAEVFDLSADDKKWLGVDRGWLALRRGRHLAIEHDGVHEVPPPRGFPEDARAGGFLLVDHVTTIHVLD